MPCDKISFVTTCSRLCVITPVIKFEDGVSTKYWLTILGRYVQVFLMWVWVCTEPSYNDEQMNGIQKRRRRKTLWVIVKQEGVWVAWNEMLSGVSHHVQTSIVCAVDHHTTPPRLECSCCVNSILEIIGKCFWAINEWPLLSNAMLWLLLIQFKLFAQMIGLIIVSNKKFAGLLKTH